MTDAERPAEPPTVVRLNFASLQRMRPRDLHAMEEHLGRKFGSMADLDIRQLDALQLWGIAFLQVRRDYPDVTWEQVGDMDVTMADEEADENGAPLGQVTTDDTESGS